MSWVFLCFLLTSFLSRCFSLAASPLDDPCLAGSTVDIMYALDTTMSMQSSKEYVRNQLPKLMQRFIEKLPKSRFGLLTFNDEDTECKETQQWNNYGTSLEFKLTSNFTAIKEVVEEYDPVNGDCFEPEDSMGALLVSALDEGVGWRNDLKEHYYRFVVVVTDAPFRKDDDNPVVCPNNKRKANDGDADYDHKLEMYPTTDQVLEALKQKNILPLFVSLDNPEGTNHQAVYEELLKQWNIGGATVVGKNNQDLVDKVPDYIRRVVCAVPLTPTPEIPPTDIPKTVIPKTDVPKTDVPKTDVPKTDVPKTDVPKTDETSVPTPEIPPLDVFSPDVPSPELSPLDVSSSDVPSDVPTVHPHFVAVSGMIFAAVLVVGALGRILMNLPSTEPITMDGWFEADETGQGDLSTEDLAVIATADNFV